MQKALYSTVIEMKTRRLDLCKAPTYILNIFFFPPIFTIILKIYKDSFLLWPEVGLILLLSERHTAYRVYERNGIV